MRLAQPAQSAAPLTLTLQDALARAQMYEPQFLGAVDATELAKQDTLQARAAQKPSAGLSSQYLNTQGNGVFPSGRFVTNDGVHVYREWAVFHQDLSPGTLSGTAVERATAAEAVARAKQEVARRGLTVTVTRAYYALVNAQRKYATAQNALADAERYVTISRNLERGGETPHSDVVKAQIQYNAQQVAMREAQLAMNNGRLDLAVLLFPNFEQNFQVIDDLNSASPLPSLDEVETLARRENPDLRAAQQTLRGANLDVTIAHQAYLPTLSVDVVYGLEANQIGWNTVVAADPRKGAVPSVGYFLTAALTFPVWDWGTRRSKLRQAEIKRDQARLDVEVTQRELARNLNSFYDEARAAREEMELLKSGADLAAENLRLNTLRYEAGEATILELVDAQNTLTQARNAYDDSQVRYRLALANLQTLTGSF
ncbi:MAG TPA: TolC family protein [Bryobacteraceae bacterium]|nr:TolC family protein [Bryobacteraceae bacterium]